MRRCTQKSTAVSNSIRFRDPLKTLVHQTGFLRIVYVVCKPVHIAQMDSFSLWMIRGGGGGWKEMKELVLIFSNGFFFFFYFILLYDTVLVLPYIDMNPPRVYMSSHSWTPLPSPTPYHLSGSSPCTSPKHPVSCIEHRLVIRFLPW